MRIENLSIFINGMIFCLILIYITALWYPSKAREFVRTECLERDNKEACKIMGEFYK